MILFFCLFIFSPSCLIACVKDSPLTLRDGYLHCPLVHAPDNELSDIQAQVWAAGYTRSADKAYPASKECCMNSLAKLFFGKSTFTFNQAFGNKVVPTVPAFLINVVTVTPEINWQENGAYFGAKSAFRYGKKKKGSMGLRGSIPFRSLEIENNGLNAQGGIDDLRLIITEQIPVHTTVNSGFNQTETSSGYTGTGTVTNSYAYRMDLLSTLPLAACSNEPLVSYSSVPLTIAIQDVTKNAFSQSGAYAPGVTVIHPAATLSAQKLPRCTGFDGITAGNFAIDRITASQLQPLPTDGIIAPGERARFDGATDYTPLQNNAASLQNLYLTRTVTERITDISGVTTVTPGLVDTSNVSQAIYTQVEGVIPLIATNLDPFIADAQLDFSTYKRVGVGDLYVEYFLGYDFSDCLWNECAFGVLFPTGKKKNNPYQVYGLPLGNNGHYEIRLRDVFEYAPCSYFKTKLDLSYNWALRGQEVLAPQFAGATITGIPVGKPVCADVSWEYFWGRLDCTFIEPYTKSGGVDLGYEVYAKTKDHIQFVQKTAETFFGTT